MLRTYGMHYLKWRDEPAQYCCIMVSLPRPFSTPKCLSIDLKYIIAELKIAASGTTVVL